MIALHARRVALRALACLLLGSVSCDNPLSPDSDSVDRIDVTPPGVSMTVGESRTIATRLVGADGATVNGRSMFWATQNAAVATVSQSGVITGVAAGNTQVAVSAGGKSAIVQVGVTARPVSQVRITPATASLQVGNAVTLRAEPVDATGAAVAGRTVLWGSTPGTIATVTSTGVVTGVAAGSATITATVDGVVGSSVVTVTPVPVASVTVSPSTGSLVVGQTLQLGATTASSTGQTLTGRVVTWSSSANAVATVSSTGLVSAVAAGSATISATSEGRTGTARLTVTDVPVASVRVTPTTATVASGQTAQLAAQALDANNNVLNRTIAWSSDQPSMATVSQTGLVTGINAGSVRINASVGNVTGSATITVTPVPVASITIAPNGATVLVGGTQQLTATARDANGVTLPGRIVTWISGAPSVATVSQSGLVSAVGPGSAVIFAGTEGVSASVTITVTTVGVSVVRVVPSTGSIQQGTQLQLNTQVLDANNNPITGKVPTWSSSNEAIATVSSTGRVLGIAPGTVTITATVDGVIGTGTYAVSPVPVGAIALVPSVATLAPGGTQTLVPNLTGTNGLPLSPIGRTIIWSSSNTAVATVSTTGVVTAVGQGTATITATTEGVSGTATITVSSTPIASITVAPNPASVQEGNAAPLVLTATARDANNNVLAGRTFFWSSNNPLVSVNSSNGQVTALIGAGGGVATITASAPGGGPGGSTPSATTTVNVSWAPVATTVVSPAVATLSVGSTLPLALTIRNAAGTLLPVSGRSVRWLSLDPAFATVGVTSGVVTGVGSGSARIELLVYSPLQDTLTAPRDTALITVQNVAPVASITLAIAPDSQILARQPSLTGTATLRDAANNLLQGRSVSFSTSNPAIATVSPLSATSNASGQITGITISGVGAGSATITATRDVSATFVARILDTVSTVSLAMSPQDSVIGAPGATINATAIRLAANGDTLGIRPTTWNSVHPTFATVSPSGVVTAVNYGSATITATSEGKTGSRVFSLLRPVSSVIVGSPGDSVIGTGTIQMVDTLKDVNGVVLTGRPVFWDVSAGSAFASVNASTGVVTALAPGNATIRATSESVSATKVIRVLAPVASLVLSPPMPADSLFVTQTLPLVVTATSSGGSPLPGRTLTVTAPNPAFVTIPAGPYVTDQNGQVNLPATYVAAGSSTLTVSVNGQSVSRTLRMLPPVASVTLTSTTMGDSIIHAGTKQLTARFFDAALVELFGRSVSWSVQPAGAAFASVSQAGIVTSLAPGSATITALVEGQSANFPVRVLYPVNSVTVEAPDSSIYVTQTVQATAQPRDINNAVLNRPVTWSSSNASVATVNSSGVVTAVAVGSATITATSETKTGSFTLTVSLVPTHTITITPTSVTHGTTPTFTALLADTAGNTLTGRTVTWSASNAKISINATSGSATLADTGQVYVIAETSPGTGMGGIKKDSVLATVNLVPINTVTVTSSPDSTLGLGTTQQVDVAVTVVGGGPAFAPSGRTCSIVSSAPSIISVSAASAVTIAAGTFSFNATANAMNTGSATMTVTCEGKVGTLLLTVQ
ncbi:MAG: Ig-like domain-containing protein [Gemmatimonadaceae bacterium]|nr:Ig-like domain-containing protein [Gemmatimonadaceae bacterium]